MGRTDSRVAASIPDAHSLQIAPPRSDGYFFVRDFELVQPLYDLAFFVEIQALAGEVAVPKYRTFSLWRAALGLDSYGTALGQWLQGDLKTAKLDQPPSSRIKQHLLQVQQTGTLQELKAFKNRRFQRALRLRSVRGLGPVAIARSLGVGQLDGSWTAEMGITDSDTAKRIVQVEKDEYFGTWQSAHVIPPLLRLFAKLEKVVGTEIGWSLQGIDSPVESVRTMPRVVSDQAWSALAKAIKQVLKEEVHFRLVAAVEGTSVVVQHGLGWKALFANETCGAKIRSIAELASRLDPLSADLDARIVGDLHAHSSWSDGAASVEAMSAAASEQGLRYLALTDHSRSSKLQGGLTPLLWIRQAASLALMQPRCPLLHGIEVDILKDGRLDLPDSLLELTDIVVASVHSNWSDDIHVNTRRLITSIESGHIDVIAHGTSALTGKPGVPEYVRGPAPVDWNFVFRKCAEWRVAIEFNCFPSRLDLNIPLLQEAAELGCMISIGSDAHAREHLLNLRFGREVLRQIPQAAILNLLEYDVLLETIKNSRNLRRSLQRSRPWRAHAQENLFHDVSAPMRRHLKFSCRLAPQIALPAGSSVMGIDLTAGAKQTGVAFLQGLEVETVSVGNDDQILSLIDKWKPRIVSIDSPLGLPGGGRDIDPKAGIVRVAERDLASIGIPAYPALIDSMKMLTLRGINLRLAIEALPEAPTVIESYPGAAQDIFCIPRKQRGLSLLREGLRRLGIHGTGLETDSHDEMDAITSAIVGRYYETGLYEPMGIPSEAQLIVPKAAPIKFDSNPIICLSGKTGAGKSVVARYLSVFYGFQWVRTRDLIRDLLLEDHSLQPSKRLWNREIDPSAVTEEDLRDFGAVVLTVHNQKPLRDALNRKIRSSQTPLIIDSIRDESDVLPDGNESRPLATWYIDCSDAVIRQRLLARPKLGVQRQTGESVIDSRAENLLAAADRIVSNDGTLDGLRWEIDDALFSMLDVSNSSLHLINLRKNA